MAGGIGGDFKYGGNDYTFSQEADEGGLAKFTVGSGDDEFEVTLSKELVGNQAETADKIKDLLTLINLEGGAQEAQVTGNLERPVVQIKTSSDEGFRDFSAGDSAAKANEIGVKILGTSSEPSATSHTSLAKNVVSSPVQQSPTHEMAAATQRVLGDAKNQSTVASQEHVVPPVTTEVLSSPQSPSTRRRRHSLGSTPLNPTDPLVSSPTVNTRSERDLSLTDVVSGSDGGTGATLHPETGVHSPGTGDQSGARTGLETASLKVGKKIPDGPPSTLVDSAESREVPPPPREMTTEEQMDEGFTFDSVLKQMLMGAEDQESLDARLESGGKFLVESFAIGFVNGLNDNQVAKNSINAGTMKAKKELTQAGREDFSSHIQSAVATRIKDAAKHLSGMENVDKSNPLIAKFLSGKIENADMTKENLRTILTFLEGRAEELGEAVRYGSSSAAEELRAVEFNGSTVKIAYLALDTVGSKDLGAEINTRLQTRVKESRSRTQLQNFGKWIDAKSKTHPKLRTKSPASLGELKPQLMAKLEAAQTAANHEPLNSFVKEESLDSILDDFLKDGAETTKLSTFEGRMTAPSSPLSAKITARPKTPVKTPAQQAISKITEGNSDYAGALVLAATLLESESKPVIDKLKELARQEIQSPENDGNYTTATAIVEALTRAPDGKFATSKNELDNELRQAKAGFATLKEAKTLIEAGEYDRVLTSVEGERDPESVVTALKNKALELFRGGDLDGADGIARILARKPELEATGREITDAVTPAREEATLALVLPKITGDSPDYAGALTDAISNGNPEKVEAKLKEIAKENIDPSNTTDGFGAAEAIAEALIQTTVKTVVEGVEQENAPFAQAGLDLREEIKVARQAIVDLEEVTTQIEDGDYTTALAGAKNLSEKGQLTVTENLTEIVDGLIEDNTPLSLHEANELITLLKGPESGFTSLGETLQAKVTEKIITPEKRLQDLISPREGGEIEPRAATDNLRDYISDQLLNHSSKETVKDGSAVNAAQENAVGTTATVFSSVNSAQKKSVFNKKGIKKLRSQFEKSRTSYLPGQTDGRSDIKKRAESFLKGELNITNLRSEDLKNIFTEINTALGSASKLAPDERTALEGALKTLSNTATLLKATENLFSTNYADDLLFEAQVRTTSKGDAITEFQTAQSNYDSAAIGSDERATAREILGKARDLAKEKNIDTEKIPTSLNTRRLINSGNHSEALAMAISLGGPDLTSTIRELKSKATSLLETGNFRETVPIIEAFDRAATEHPTEGWLLTAATDLVELSAETMNVRTDQDRLTTKRREIKTAIQEISKERSEFSQFIPTFISERMSGVKTKEQALEFLKKEEDAVRDQLLESIMNAEAKSASASQELGDTGFNPLTFRPPPRVRKKTTQSQTAAPLPGTPEAKAHEAFSRIAENNFNDAALLLDELDAGSEDYNKFVSTLKSEEGVKEIINRAVQNEGSLGRLDTSAQKIFNALFSPDMLSEAQTLVEAGSFNEAKAIGRQLVTTCDYEKAKDIGVGILSSDLSSPAKLSEALDTALSLATELESMNTPVSKAAAVNILDKAVELFNAVETTPATRSTIQTKLKGAMSERISLASENRMDKELKKQFADSLNAYLKDNNVITQEEFEQNSHRLQPSEPRRRSPNVQRRRLRRSKKPKQPSSPSNASTGQVGSGSASQTSATLTEKADGEAQAGIAINALNGSDVGRYQTALDAFQKLTDGSEAQKAFAGVFDGVDNEEIKPILTQVAFEGSAGGPASTLLEALRPTLKTVLASSERPNIGSITSASVTKTGIPENSVQTEAEKASQALLGDTENRFDTALAAFKKVKSDPSARAIFKRVLEATTKHDGTDAMSMLTRAKASESLSSPTDPKPATELFNMIDPTGA